MLDSRLGLDEPVAKKKLRGFDITPFNPRSKTREVLATFPEKGLPVDAIECVLEIDLKEDLVGVRSIPGSPLTNCVDGRFRA